MENLCAAIPVGDLSNNLSAQEFQKMLCSWFEEKVIGRDIGKRTLQRISLSKQAVNLIVAEFLMQNKCHYTLSIFNTEASLTNILPEYPVIFENDTMKEKEMYHFDKENILNMMELIGITKGSIYCDELLSSYFGGQENNSILSCLISLLCKLICKDERKPSNEDFDAELIDLGEEDSFIKEVGNILIRSELSTNKDLKIVLENIKTFYEIEKKNLEKERSRLTNELKIKIENQERKIKEMQKAKYLLENHFVKINKEYRKLKSHMKNLITRDKSLKESYVKQNMNVNDFAKIANNNLKENKSVSNSPVLKHQNIEICQLQHCSEICKENVRHAEELIKKKSNFK
ncbi:hypothetical protein NQ314_017801 [Rhamnusium bicolor]|uniref:LisH domain-containing protein n=1 Tax=Rhamnusium bicolor TaxID=1586634 RepID=A0AAV8WSW1_9CUCU|nr:hypothetical protein NQ314_017801 [Rhamnusium bicolor]